MHFLYVWITFCIFSSFHLSAACADTKGEAIPPDISYLVADLKFNDQQGVQICEVQLGRISRFRGYDFINNGEGLIMLKLAKVLKGCHATGWFLKHDIRDPLADQALRAVGWRGFESLEELLDDPEFQAIAGQPNTQAASIADYGGVLFARHGSLGTLEDFKKRFPNVLIIDEATRDYCGDKLKTNLLFTSPELQKFKPAWNLYSKEYSPDLSRRIMEEVDSDYFVIKPRRGAKGNGVIICSCAELDGTLDYILNPEESLLEDPDPSYRYWAYDLSTSFIVEAYAPSNPIVVEYLKNEEFDATMRVMYVLTHSDEKMDLHFLGSYWKLPKRSLERGGSLNECHKSCGAVPFYSIVDCATDIEVKDQLHECFFYLYELMLQGEYRLYKKAA